MRLHIATHFPIPLLDDPFCGFATQQQQQQQQQRQLALSSSKRSRSRRT
jgi:hypothetical protein